MHGYMDEINKLTKNNSKYLSGGGTNVEMDGVQACAYARIRYTTGDDYKRTERQRTVLTAMVQKAQKANLTTINSLIDELFGDIKTSFSNTELISLAAKVFNYSLGETIGFPFEKNTTTLGNKGSVVVPCDLESNVKQLHVFLYDDNEYAPTDTVKNNSAQIVNDTGFSSGRRILMKADLIIPTYRPDDTFCLLLQKLQEQTFVVHRVIILNTEEKLWKEAVEKYPIEQSLCGLPCEYTLYHISKEMFDHGGTRMCGVKHSDADIVIFMTQDAVPADKNLVANLVKGLEEKDTAVCYARQLPNENCRIVERYTRSFNYPDESRKKGKADIEEMGIKTFFCSDVCAAYREDTVFINLADSNHRLFLMKICFLPQKRVFAGYYVKYEAEAKVIHSHNYTVRQQFHRNFDLAVSQTMHPEIFEQISSEAEGMKLVKSTMKYLCSIGKPYLIFELGIQCVGKYAGYRLGKRYKKLSRKQILKCTMSPEYWKRLWNQEVSDGNR